ncbi:uncharacterized protein LOC131225621 isoform X2 [Magnolia sinica]|uniref:uncharacterized protein LOC131225621 isoform X2 n=1 Tax=Magnolia sinica TaxID=86752 RepID=UPI00265AD5D2|nr:uncharacterized protein LOC131225621 isoform X2 [Magnolia sinica]
MVLILEDSGCQLDHNATFMFLLLSFKRGKMLWIHVKGSFCLTVIYAHEVAGNRDDCSTSETHQSRTCDRSPRSRSHATGEWSRRKRWRGRVEWLEVTPDFSFVETSRTGAHTSTWSARSFLDDDRDSSPKFQQWESNKKKLNQMVSGPRNYAVKYKMAPVV